MVFESLEPRRMLAANIMLSFQRGEFNFSVADGEAVPIEIGVGALGSSPGPSMTFLVRNFGFEVNEDLLLGPVSVSPQFQIAEPLADVLAPGESDTFTVTLLTSVEGPIAGEVSIPNSVDAEDPFNFAISGRVTGPNFPPEAEIAIEAELTPGIPSGGTIGFTSAVRGQAAAARSFSVRNLGTGPLEVRQVSIPPGFVLVSPPAPVVQPGASTAFEIALETSAIGTFAGPVTVSSNDADESLFTFNLTGTVRSEFPAGANIDVGVFDSVAGLEPAGQRQTLAQGAAVDFGTALVGSSLARAFTILNDGTAPLALGALDLPDGFTLLRGPSSSTVTPGASETFVVGLDTSSPASRGGTLALTNSDPDVQPFSAALLAVVTDAPITVEAVELAAPSPLVAGSAGAKGTATVTLGNIGAAAFAGRVAIAVAASADGLLDPSDPRLLETDKAIKLAPGQSRAIKLRVSFPSAVAAGRQLLLASAVADGKTSTAAGPAVVVEAPVVRLRGPASMQLLEKPLKFGRRAAIAISLRNEGNVPSSRLPAMFTLAVSPVSDDAATVFETSIVTSIKLRPGASRTQRLNVLFPAGAFPAGNYRLSVSVNADLNDLNGQPIALLSFAVG